MLNGRTFTWSSIGEIGEVRMCKRILKEQTTTNGEIPFYKIGTFGKKADAFISRDIFNEYKQKYNYPKKGEILISASGTIGRTVVFDGEDAYFQDSNIVWIEHDESRILNEFLYYVYQNVNWGASEGGTISRLYNENLRKILIPIPPLDVQAEIVRILDTFTAVTAELTAELNMREKQYQYYRDKFLSFSSDEINWKILGELGQLIRGNGLQKSDFTEDGFPAIHYGQIYTFYGTFADKTKSFVSENLAKKLKKAQNGDVLLAGTSENIQDVMKPLGWLGNEIAISGDMFAFRPNTELDTKYLTYLLQTTEFQKYKEKYAHGTKVTRLNAEKFLRFKIAIPPLDKQKRIVNILDKFEALTHSITEGLPKEITLRKQQYEYYREQLIDFPKN
nr:restriction endonuclease subunit S [Moraxella osloensis]